MKVPFVHGPNDLRLCDIDLPQPGSGDVLLRVAATGICGSDLGYIAAGGLTGPGGAPLPLGHELSGTVIHAGTAVTTVAHGDRVVVNPLINMIGNGGPDGGFAEQLLVRDVAGKPESLIRLPDSITLEAGALVEPLAVAAHAVNRLALPPGASVAIFGAGPIGLACVITLRQRGVQNIVVFEPSAFRRERALRLGAHAALDPAGKPPEASLRALHGTVRVFRSDAPATTHFLETSGAPLLPAIIGFARAQAVICVVSVQKKPAQVDFRTVMAKELTLTGALGYPTEFPAAIAMLAEGGIDLDAMISHRFAAADVMAAFAMAAQPDQAAKVLVRY